MKQLILVVFLAACSSKGNSDCEGLKTKYMAWADAKTKEALASDDAAHLAKDQADADKEHAAADAKFIGACQEIKLDPTCWVDNLDKDKKAACKSMQHDLDVKLYR